jgi:putative NADPH-quinone reductase
VFYENRLDGYNPGKMNKGIQMKIVVILAHPDKHSFNAAIAQTVLETLRRNRHDVIFHDLYAEKFDPLLHHPEFGRDAALPAQIQQHCNEIASADGIVIVHPNWWGQPPAVLKGWIDRVIRPGVAYRFDEGDSGEGVPVGLLKAKTAVVFNTANTSADREENIFGDPLQRIWKDCIFDLCGVKDFHRRMFRIICTSAPDQRQQWLAEAAALIDNHFPA